MKPATRPLAAALLALAAPAVPQDGPIVRGGLPMPSLELPTIDGRRALDLAALAEGRKVLLIQFASW